MAEVNDALERLRVAGNRLAATQLEHDKARRERDAALFAARDARATYVEMQEAGGLSQVTIAKIFKRGPHDEDA